MSQTLRILLIADDPDVIRRVGDGLRRHGPDAALIEGADSLATARRRLGSGFYDLAILDMALGGSSDGLHALSHLYALAPDLPVVALATGAEAPGIEACLALGAADRVAAEALDASGLLDRLQAATARAQVGLAARRRSERIARSLAASGDVAWHFESGEDEVWLAAPDAAAWRLPAPEWRESLDVLRGRIHPDDRELVLRQLEELVAASGPWHIEARFKVGEAYRWLALRGQSHRDERGGIEHVAGVLSDAQDQQKRLRELEHNRRFLRAVFDSDRIPQAVIDSYAVITECNPAWEALNDPACHAGAAFPPGRKFVEKAAQAGAFGDLDVGALARGVRQVLGGVAEQFSCEYGDGEQRWRILVTPLLNPGIAGAVLSHEEITAERHEASEQIARLETLERDLQAIPGPLYCLAADFSVRAANADGHALGRSPVVGRDILKVLPRRYENAVGDALATVAAGAESAIRDSRSPDGSVMRWSLRALRNSDGSGHGILVHGVEVSDLAAAAPAAALPFAVAVADEHETLVAAKAELAQLRAAWAEAEAVRVAERKSWAVAEAEREALFAKLEQARRDAEQARDEAEQAREEAEQAREEVERAREEAEQARQEAAEAVDRAGTMRDTEAGIRQERASMVKALDAERAKRAALDEALDGERAKRAALDDALDAERAERAALAAALDAERAGRTALAEVLDAERAGRAALAEALDAARSSHATLTEALDRARHGLRGRIDELFDRVFEPLLVQPGSASPPPAVPVANEESEAK
jgi:CheY-like chemotaxis protein